MDTNVNVPLLRKAVEWAEAEAAKPEIDRQWDQGSWITPPEDRAAYWLEDSPLAYDEDALDAIAPHCGTAYCIAGWIGQHQDPRYVETDVVDGVHVAVFAAVELGIDYHAAMGFNDGLFNGLNRIQDVRRIAEEIAGERL